LLSKDVEKLVEEVEEAAKVAAKDKLKRTMVSEIGGIQGGEEVTLLRRYSV